MALDMLLQIDGVKGESKIKDKTDWIDVLAWSWSASNSGTFHTGGGGGGGKANVQDISITKWIDKATPDLGLAAMSGKHFATAKLEVRKAGDTPKPYLQVNLKNVLVTNYSTGGSGGEDRLTENVTLNFQEIELIYLMQDDKGVTSTAGKFKYDVAANSKL